jgi:hypothetical protein
MKAAGLLNSDVPDVKGMTIEEEEDLDERYRLKSEEEELRMLEIDELQIRALILGTVP